MSRNTLNTHWAAVGDPIPQPQHPRNPAWRAWLKERALEAGLTPQEHRVAECAIVERKTLPAIAQTLKIRTAEAKALQERALELLSSLPDYYAAAREFEAQVVRLSENKTDFDERPPGVRGVNPDRASDKLQGSKVVGYNDPRMRQDTLSAGRLLMLQETYQGV